MHDNNGEENVSSPSNLLPPNPNPNPNPNPIDSSKRTRIMENLKAAVLARLAESHPNKTFSPSQIAAIERGLAQAFPSFKTPTHPTYASMIQEAIEKLEDEGGSTEGSISHYIVEHFKGLPWAHRRYLSHYLGKMCENGEIVCSPGKCYTIPGLITRPKSRKKQLRPNAGRKRKEHETDEGNFGEEELIGINENEVCFEEEKTRVFTKNQGKRRRSSLVVYEEDEEVGGEEGAEREDNMIRNSETPVIEEHNKLLELNGGDEVGKDGEMRQHGSGTDDNGGDEVVGCKEDAEPQAGLVESIGDKLMPKEGEDEVRTEVLSLDHDDSNNGKTELLGPSTMEKTLPAECEDRMGTEAWQLGHESGDANLMLIPIESEKKSALEEDNHIGTSGDVPEETLKKSAIMERDDHSFRTADLMIVPFEGDTSSPAVRKEKKPVVQERMGTIVCGLPYQVPGEPKRKQLVYRPRSKQSQKKALLLLDKSQLASPVGPKLLEYGQSEVSPQTGSETKLDQTLQDPSMLNKLPLQTEKAQTSSPHGTTPMIPAVEGSHKLESEKAKSHLEPSPSSGTPELMSMDNDDLDVPLNQVLQNCCKQRKLSEEIPTSKVVASGREPPGVENPAKTMRQRRKKELTVTKRKQKQRQQLKKPHKSQAQKFDDLEAGSATAPESGVFLSFHMEEGCDDGNIRHEDQEPHDQGRCVLDGQHHELGENQQKTMDCGLSTELERTREVGLRESSPPGNQNGHKEEYRKQQNQTEKGDVASCDTEAMTAAIMEEKVPPETKDSQFMEIPTCPGEIASQQEESQCPANHLHKEMAAGEFGKGDEQKIKQPKRPGRGRPQKQKEEAPSEPKADGQTASLGFERTSNGLLVSDFSPGQQLMVEPLSAKLDSLCDLDQIEDHQTKDESQVGVLDPDPHFATLVDAKVCVSNQYPQECNKEVKIERRGRPRKQKEDTKDQQNKQPKKDGRGRPRKKKEEMKEVAAPLNVYDQLQEGASEPLINKDGDGSPRKEKEETTENVAASLDSHDQKEDGPNHQPSSQQRLKKDGRGRPRKQGLLIREDGAAPSHLRRGRPRRVTKEDAEVAVQRNLGERLQEGPCDSENQQNKQPKRDGRGRPRKQDRAITEDAAAPEQIRDGRGRPRKPKGGTKENEATMSHQQEQLNEREGLQQGTDGQVIIQDSELSGTLEAPLSLGNQSDWDSREQKQHGQEDESHKQEKEHKSHKEGKCPHFLDEQPGKSQGQVHGTPCDQEQVTVNETSEQLEERNEDGGGQLPGSELVTEAVIDQPSQEEKQCQLHEEEGGQSRDQGKTPKQKAAKTKAIEVPLSSKTSLRSRNR